MGSFDEERELLWLSVRQLKRQRCLPAIREARQLLLVWLKQHPDDYATLDVNHELIRMEGAIEIIEAEKAAAKAVDLVAA